MTTTFPFVNLDTLPDFAMLGGIDFNLIFNIYNSGSQLVDLNGSTISWKLCPYGSSTSVLTKSGTSGSVTGQFIISLVPADTLTLGGRYRQEYIVLDDQNHTFRARGLVLIGDPAI